MQNWLQLLKLGKLKFTEVTTREGGRPVVEIRDALADAMWNKVGIFRNEEGITEALKEIEQLD